jgi:hypothetical protein
LLTKNREKDNIIFISSNPLRIVAAIKQGFQTIPIVQFESSNQQDFQLNLVENYILKVRLLTEMKAHLQCNFSILT